MHPLYSARPRCNNTERRLMVQRLLVRIRLTLGGGGLVARGVYFDSAVAELVARFGKRLRSQRVALGLSQPMLYEKTGVSPPYIAQIELGKVNPSFGVMVRLAGAVGLELHDMLRPDHSEGE